VNQLHFQGMEERLHGSVDAPIEVKRLKRRSREACWCSRDSRRSPVQQSA
jgi:hypothetical protein